MPVPLADPSAPTNLRPGTIGLTMQHCYLLQTHTNPAQILRLARLLRRGSPQATIVISHDPSQCTLDPEETAAAGILEVLHPRTKPQRGEFTLVETYLDALEHLLARAVPFDWLTYISGQDYPLVPLAEYEKRIECSPYDAFLRCTDVLSPQGPWGRSKRGHRRYFFAYRRLHPRQRWLLRGMRLLNGLQSLYHVQLTYGNHLGWRRLNTLFEGGVRCYAGSQWHSINRACVDHLARMRREEPRWSEYFRRTICPDEAFVPTLLANAGRFRICFDNLRFVDFAGSKTGSPRLLTVADLPQLLASDSCFARKFDAAVDSVVLDRLDERVQAAPARRESESS